MLGPGPGVRVLDAGCGRGEVLLACAAAGSEVAGLDYAEAAVEISRETLAGVEGADVRQGDVTRLPWDDASFDRVIFADVIEHLDPDQADGALREFRRVLRPGGVLLVHTAPNRLFLDVTWPVARVVLKAAGRGESVRALDEWLAMAEQYHVNEQTVHSLRKAVRAAGFPDARAWLDPNVLRSGEHHLTSGLTEGSLMAVVGRIASLRPLRMFLGNDLYAMARRPA
jgi:ubiquinone/menaquinone biosynthesis C-methylase UbiE